VEPGLTASEELWVRELIVRHWHATGSRLAKKLDEEWAAARRRFHRVSPLGATRADGTRLLPFLSDVDVVETTPARAQRVRSNELSARA
jgi:glutamate synthase domain-containing protein 3